jgi:hypothetical protein
MWRSISVQQFLICNFQFAFCNGQERAFRRASHYHIGKTSGAVRIDRRVIHLSQENSSCTCYRFEELC